MAEGKATHPSLTGRPVRVTPATVAREARRSRNPLSTTHCAIPDETAISAVATEALAALVEWVT